MIPLYKPFVPELPCLDEILHSGQLAYGKYTQEFEQKLTEYVNVEIPCIAVNNFAIGVYVTLQALGLKPGDEIIASPMGCLVSTQPLITYGLKIKWADIDVKTGTLNPDSVKSVISKNTKAIFHNHFCGYAGYIDEINSIGKEYGIPVIDDCIEAFGTEYRGNKLGNNGSDVAIFNFSAVRTLNTIEGGALFFKDRKLYEKAFLICDSGIDRTKFRDELGEINPECDITMPGYSAKMSNVNAYIGLQDLKHVVQNVEHQRHNAEIWKNKLNGFDLLGKDFATPNYWVFGILVKNKKETISNFRNSGFYASGVHINNNIYSVFGKQPTLQGVQEFMNSFVALPCGWWISEEDIKEASVKC